MADVNKEIGLRIDIEVGKLNDQIGGVEAKILGLQQEIDKMRKGSKNTTSEMAAGFKAIEAQASALPGPIGQVANALGSVREGVVAFSVSLKSLRGALIATGIGAFAVILGSLYEYFTGSERGAKQFRVALAFLEGSFETLANLLEKIAINLINLFTEPQQTLKEFAGGIKTYVIDNFNKILGGAGTLGKALKQLFARDFAGALSTAKDGVKELGDGFLSLNPLTAYAWNAAKAVKAIGIEAYDSANAFAALEARMNAIKVAERELTIERARSNKTIAEARLIADDATRSIEERIAAVRRAGALEEEVAAKEQKIANNRLKVLEDERNAGKEEEKQIEAIAAAQVRVYELERETIMRRKRLQSEEIALLREAAAVKKATNAEEAERLKALAAEREKLWADEQAKYKAHLTMLSDLKVENIESEEEREIQAEILAFERKIAAIQGQGEMEMAIREQMQIALHNKLQAIDTKYRAQEKAATDAAAKQEIATAQMVAQAKWSAAQQSGNALIGIGRLVTTAMADNAEVAKGIATAEVWINAATATASAISKAVQSSVTPYDMIANIAVAVGTVAGAIASTIEILNQADIPGGGGGAAIGNMPSFTASAPQGAAVSTNVTGLVNTQQAELQPIQAFVVETAMTGTQSNIEQIYGQATFGLGG